MLFCIFGFRFSTWQNMIPKMARFNEMNYWQEEQILTVIYVVWTEFPSHRSIYIYCGNDMTRMIAASPPMAQHNKVNLIPLKDLAKWLLTPPVYITWQYFLLKPLFVEGKKKEQNGILPWHMCKSYIQWSGSEDISWGGIASNKGRRYHPFWWG